jgi:hypothetical protein
MRAVWGRIWHACTPSFDMSTTLAKTSGAVLRFNKLAWRINGLGSMYVRELSHTGRTSSLVARQLKDGLIESLMLSPT